jgi:hypothetical protein
MARTDEHLTLPTDLREWFEAETLRPWITAEVDSLDWSNPPVLEYLRHRRDHHPKAMLGVLTLAYAVSIFDIWELAEACRQDAAFRQLSGEWMPDDPAEIARFRRENRGLLKWSLYQLYKRAVRQRLQETRLPMGVKRVLHEAAAARVILARRMDAAVEDI